MDKEQRLAERAPQNGQEREAIAEQSMAGRGRKQRKEDLDG